MRRVTLGQSCLGTNTDDTDPWTIACTQQQILFISNICKTAHIERDGACTGCHDSYHIGCQLELQELGHLNTSHIEAKEQQNADPQASTDNLSQAMQPACGNAI